MQKLKKIKANGFYVFHGKSNANSCFIEKIIHAKKFLIYANYFLKDYLSIYDYIITKEGWSMVVKIKSKKHLLTEEIEGSEVWSIISERIRLFLSTFVRVTNKEKGRTGCLVHSGYERYYFESKNEALDYISRIRKQQIKFYSKKKKYRSLKTHYVISVNNAKGSIFLCSKEIRKLKKEVAEFADVIDFIDLQKLVVQKMVNSTLNLHHPSKFLNPT